jgi:hypothetical protein
MGGQSWPELELHGRRAYRRGETGGRGGREGGAVGGAVAVGGAATRGGDSIPAAPCSCSLFGPCACVRKKA